MLVLQEYKGIIKEYGLNTSIDYLNSSNVTIGADYKDFEDKADIDKEYNNKVYLYQIQISFLMIKLSLHKL